VPSQTIDVILWDDSENDQIMASPISSAGLRFLKTLTGDEDTGIMSITTTPNEFAHHIPSGLRVLFIGEDGIAMPVEAILGLQ